MCERFGQNGYILFKLDVTNFGERRAARMPGCCGPAVLGVHSRCPELCTVERRLIAALAVARGQRSPNVTNGPTFTPRKDWKQQGCKAQDQAGNPSRALFPQAGRHYCTA